jgi:5'-nucleotidase/UDP-sugar diphosphatase
MKAEAAVLNGGGIRASKIYEPGSRISQGNILAELPFNNRVVVIEISGAELKRAMENGLALLPQPSGRFPQVSGITVQFDLSRKPRERVVAMQVAGNPLVEDRTYRVAVLDFLARGGDDYTMFRDAKRITPDNDAPLMVNEVVNYLRKIGTVRTGVEGRIAAT